MTLRAFPGRGWGVWAARTLLVVVAAIGLVLCIQTSVRADEPRLILGTTVWLEASGLPGSLVALFAQQTGRRVTTIAVSAPQVLTLGARGELDVLLVDAAEDEAAYMAAGHGVERRLVMHGDDVVVGPRADPARAGEATALDDALRRIAASDSGWVSRADNSGLYQLEKRLWHAAGVDPQGQPWYLALGQGMLPTLAATTERQAYTLADRLTFLDRRDSLDLAIAVERAPDLLRLYHVIVVNPAKGPWIDEDGARAFADFLLGPDAQALIQTYGVERFGQPIFVPDAGRTEHELRPAVRPAA